MLIKTNQIFLHEYQPGDIIAIHNNIPILTFHGYSRIDGKPMIAVNVSNIPNPANRLEQLIQQIPQIDRYNDYNLEIQLITPINDYYGLDPVYSYELKNIKYPKLKLDKINNRFKLKLYSVA